MGSIKLGAPLHGWALALDQVPDPVFAGRMLGDGIAFEPLSGELMAPCDGRVMSVHAAGHAVSLEGEGGLELLMHIGVDTVTLDGKGFSPLVSAGDTVVRGQVLVRFDLDAVACAARSLATPMIVTNGDRFSIARSVGSGVVDAGDDVLWLDATGGPAVSAAAAQPRSGAGAQTAASSAQRSLRVPLAHGLHARPAARIGELAKTFNAGCRITKGGKSAPAVSPIGLLGLGVAHDDEILIEAEGPDADAAVAALADLIAGGMGEAASAPKAPLAAPPHVPLAPTVTSDGAWIGTTAAPGMAVGTLRRMQLAEPELDHGGGTPGHERDRLRTAIAALSARLEATVHDPREAAIRKAHRALLDDPALHEAAGALIEQGANAAWAWREACGQQADILRAVADSRLAERADDLIDLGRQLVAILLGEPESLPTYPPGTILVARELLPSHIMQLDENVAGIALEQGGPTSHVAILAAGMGIPMLVALGDRLASIEEGCEVVLDADSQSLRVRCSEEELALAYEAVSRRNAVRAANIAAAQQACATSDGTRIEIFANLGSLADAAPAVTAGAEGCGLLRTEFLFLDRGDAPSEEEQAQVYAAIDHALAGRPLIIRLMDIGGDKPAPYLPIGPEMNPALGLRGIRIGLSRPEMLDTQLRAILASLSGRPGRIMVPMVASASEIIAVRARVDALRTGMGIEVPVELGIMVETPAAAVTTATLAPHADFFSIGTNDLTQYALAMDRDNPAVASALDGLHPAVLTLIACAARGADAGGRWIGVCGGLAADPLAVPLLVGLGITELSMPSRQIPEIKALVRKLELAACRDLAETALAMTSAEEVRTLSRQFIAELLQ